MLSFFRYEKAQSLPQEWDLLCTSRFQKTDFLTHTEIHNPCKQRYYAGFIKGTMYCGAIVYTLSLNVFTYSVFTFHKTMKIMGIPCSVSCSGYIGKWTYLKPLINYIRTQETGLLLLLNIPRNEYVDSTMSIVPTVPTLIIDPVPQSWEEYMNALRSPYRRRIKKCEKKGLNLIHSHIPLSSFNHTMYSMYRDVYYHSKAQLELLTEDFFLHLPHDFQLYRLSYKETLGGWYITVLHDNSLIFFLGGINYGINKEYAVYYTMLIHIIKQAIDRKARVIDFGQTAEIPKMRVGGRLIPLSMVGYHTNHFLNTCLKFGKNILANNKKITPCNAMRKSV